MKKLWYVALGALCILLATPDNHAANASEANTAILKEASNLNPKVLALALTAYQNAIKERNIHEGILTIIDYSLPSSQKRFWVIDLNHHHVLFHTWVAHGKGSGNLYSTHFSDTRESNATSLGVYLTGHTYQGKHGYSLKLLGLEKGFNDLASARAVVIHQAWYVSPAFLSEYGRLGRSRGCPALDSTVYRPIIHTIRDGTVIVAYANNQKWLTTSQYLKVNSV